MRKKEKTILLIIAFILMGFLAWGYWKIFYLYDRQTGDVWRISYNLAWLWPHVKRENIQSISFGEIEENSDDDEIFFRSQADVPAEDLPECIAIIDKAMETAWPWWTLRSHFYRIWPGSKMKIVTNKGKYLVSAQAHISEVGVSYVCGINWKSYELGRLLAKSRYPDGYDYALPAKEDVVAIVLFSRLGEPPLALFGDKKEADKLLFHPPFSKDDPNGITISAPNLNRILRFGIQYREENGKLVWDNEIKPKHILEGHLWIEKIMDAFETALREAKEREKYYPAYLDSNAQMIFMTRDGDFSKRITIDENSVSDDYIKSEQLKEYFDELGLTAEIAAERSEKH